MPKPSPMEMRQLTISPNNVKMADQIQAYIESSSTARMEEAVITSSVRGPLFLVIPQSELSKIKKIVTRFKAAIVFNIHYHRVPFGNTHKRLELNHWKLQGKFEDHRGGEYRLFTKEGRTRLLHFPTFKLYELREVNLNVRQPKQPAK